MHVTLQIINTFGYRVKKGTQSNGNSLSNHTAGENPSRTVGGNEI